MSEKMLNTRIQQKHDIEVNWSKAVNFIPKIGEVIVYDPDENHAAARVKIGDGVKTVVELAFIDDAAKTALFKEIDMVDEKVEALGQLVGDASIPEQIEEALLKTQADWNENDETSAAYIKNKPFDYGPDYFRYEFDGNLDNQEVVIEAPGLGGLKFIKVGEALDIDFVAGLSTDKFEVGKLDGNNELVTYQVGPYRNENSPLFVQGFMSYIQTFVLNVAQDCTINDLYGLNIEELNIPIPSGLYFCDENIRYFTYKDVKKIDEIFLPPAGDWEENSLNSYSYIKNRTHYQDTQVYKFNGNYEQCECAFSPDTIDGFVKISNDTLNLNDFNKIKVTFNNSLGMRQNYMEFLKEELLNENDVITVSNLLVFYVVLADSYQIPNKNLALTKGIWVRYRKEDIAEQYISEIKFYTKVKQLDEIYIPSTIARVEDVPTIEYFTIEEIDEICGGYIAAKEMKF